MAKIDEKSDQNIDPEIFRPGFSILFTLKPFLLKFQYAHLKRNLKKKHPENYIKPSSHLFIKK
jgi:hypothetical protein